MDPNVTNSQCETEMESNKNFFRFIKIINKIRKQIVLEKRIIDIVREYEPEIIELRDKLASNTK